MYKSSFSSISSIQIHRLIRKAGILNYAANGGKEELQLVDSILLDHLLTKAIWDRDPPKFVHFAHPKYPGNNETILACLQSCILAEYLLTVQFMNLASIADALDLHPNDIPLLLVSQAALSSPSS